MSIEVEPGLFGAIALDVQLASLDLLDPLTQIGEGLWCCRGGRKGADGTGEHGAPQGFVGFWK